jgi:hypothetical protein
MSAIITQASDPGAVVDDFAVDVRDEFAQRVIGPVAFGGTARAVQRQSS